MDVSNTGPGLEQRRPAPCRRHYGRANGEGGDGGGAEPANENALAKLQELAGK